MQQFCTVNPSFLQPIFDHHWVLVQNGHTWCISPASGCGLCSNPSKDSFYQIESIIHRFFRLFRLFSGAHLLFTAHHTNHTPAQYVSSKKLLMFHRVMCTIHTAYTERCTGYRLYQREREKIKQLPADITDFQWNYSTSTHIKW